MKRTFLVYVEFDDEGEDTPLPTDDKVAAVLEHSTAAEALATATGCRVSLRLSLIAVDSLSE